LGGYGAPPAAPGWRSTTVSWPRSTRPPSAPRASATCSRRNAAA